MFHFKKFSIDDSTAAMKIGTDAVLLGAWTPCSDETRILDIGTGSGILALMMAQRTKAIIDAIEIDSDAANLAQQNARLSPWPEQIQIFNSSIQEFSAKSNNRYNLIICNPPFFTDSLKAPDKARNIARHNDTLPIKDLLKITSELLAEDGKAAFILPADAFENWSTTASSLYLYPAILTKVKSSLNHNPHRVMVVFTKNKTPEILENEISIYSSKGIYTEEYRELTRDFYLNF